MGCCCARHHLCVSAPVRCSNGCLFWDESYYAENAWPKVAATFLAAIVVWFLGRYLNSGTGRVVVDQETQEQLILKRTHTFFWLRMEYWAPLLILLGIVLAFV
jgi:hypothetical protein